MADDCLDLSAQMSFYFVLSLFPFFLVVAAIIGWLPSTALWQAFMHWVIDYLPMDSRVLVLSTILSLTRNYSSYLSIGLVFTIWSASSGFMSLMESLSVAHGLRETRGYWRRRLIATCATIGTALFALASFAVLGVGHRLGVDFAASQQWLAIPFEIGRWLATLVLAILALDLMNYFLPNWRRRWRWITPGTLFVAIAVSLATIGFDYYLEHFNGYPRLYGTLASFIILMVWIYIANLILLVGAEADTAIDQLNHQELAA
jgi:membrane protein